MWGFFFQGFSYNHEALTPILTKNAPLVFIDDCCEGFGNIKQALISVSITQPTDWSIPFKMMCETSDHAVGVFLGKRKDKKPIMI